MKILAMADHESRWLYDFYDPERMKDIDLIIACGDLGADYLEFFATLCHAPVLYVRGNHDGREGQREPEGCVCLEDDIYVFKGVRIMGLGGSMRYSREGPNQYTEKQMRKRIVRMWWKILKHRGFDILVTHAPAYHLNDLPDLPHRGFACFLTLLKRFRPTYFFHGHVHANYSSDFKRKDKYQDTTVINAYEYYVVDYPIA